MNGAAAAGNMEVVKVRKREDISAVDVMHTLCMIRLRIMLLPVPFAHELLRSQGSTAAPRFIHVYHRQVGDSYSRVIGFIGGEMVFPMVKMPRNGQR